MIKIITCGKTVAEYSDWQAAFHHAYTLSQQNRNVAVYIQDGNHRSILRNGYVL